SWAFEHTEARLAEIMRDIHARCYASAEQYGTPGDLVLGANISGFLRVAEAMNAQGLV
ncbi:MAG TPA: glutamate dehydrogenase, partial [Mycobacteriales bacterium]